MSKTLYADGQTGKVAIMDGELDMDAVNNPTDYLNKIYFHSDLNYLVFRAGVNENVPIRAIPPGDFTDYLEKLYQFAWEGEEFVILCKMNNQNVFSDGLHLDGFYRYVYLWSWVEAGILNIQFRQAVANINRPGYPAEVIHLEIMAFAPTKATDNSNTTIDIQPEQVVFSKGKFNSDFSYLKMGGSFELPMSPTIGVQQSGSAFILDFGIGTRVGVGL